VLESLPGQHHQHIEPFAEDTPRNGLHAQSFVPCPAGIDEVAHKKHQGGTKHLLSISRFRFKSRNYGGNTYNGADAYMLGNMNCSNMARRQLVVQGQGIQDD
jgi:hypothetical protein